MGSEPAKPEGGYSERAARVLADSDEWQRLTRLEHEKVLDVYIDFKSPHAYLAIRPSLEIARDYRLKVNFLPFALSFTDLGVTTSVDADMKRRPPNPRLIARLGCTTPPPASTRFCRGFHCAGRIGYWIQASHTGFSCSLKSRDWRFRS